MLLIKFSAWSHVTAGSEQWAWPGIRVKAKEGVGSAVEKWACPRSSSVRDQWSDDSLWAELVEEAIVAGVWIVSYRLLNPRLTSVCRVLNASVVQTVSPFIHQFSSVQCATLILSFLFYFHVARANNIRHIGLRTENKSYYNGNWNTRACGLADNQKIPHSRRWA